MIDINIHVDVALKESTLQFLTSLVGKTTEKTDAPSAPSNRTAQPALETKPAPAPVASPAQPATTVKAPEAKAAEPVKITDEQLGEAVKAAKDKVGAKDIRVIFNRFGINCSTDCPEGKRADLLAELTRLAS